MSKPSRDRRRRVQVCVEHVDLDAKPMTVRVPAWRDAERFEIAGVPEFVGTTTLHVPIPFWCYAMANIAVAEASDLQIGDWEDKRSAADKKLDDLHMISKQMAAGADADAASVGQLMHTMLSSSIVGGYEIFPVGNEMIELHNIDGQYTQERLVALIGELIRAYWRRRP